MVMVMVIPPLHRPTVVVHPSCAGSHSASELKLRYQLCCVEHSSLSSPVIIIRIRS